MLHLVSEQWFSKDFWDLWGVSLPCVACEIILFIDC